MYGGVVHRRDSGAGDADDALESHSPLVLAISVKPFFIDLTKSVNWVNLSNFLTWLREINEITEIIQKSVAGYLELLKMVILRGNSTMRHWYFTTRFAY